MIYGRSQNDCSLKYNNVEVLEAAHVRNSLSTLGGVVYEEGLNIITLLRTLIEIVNFYRYFLKMEPYGASTISTQQKSFDIFDFL